jgi:hypothetical protein
LALFPLPSKWINNFPWSGLELFLCGLKMKIKIIFEILTWFLFFRGLQKLADVVEAFW